MAEKEYIEREALLEKLNSDLARWVDSAAEYKEDKSGMHAMKEAILYVIAAPAADVVEVVRCKDCKYAYINSFSAQCGIAVCRSSANRIVQQDDFCSYGERKEKE